MSAKRTIGVCGAGQMGAAAAVAFKRAGYRVILWARDAAKFPAIRATIATLDGWMDEHLGPSKDRDGGVQVVGDLGRIDGEADLVIDGIAEDMTEKAALFSQLTRAKLRGALFLTTTSGLSITELGRRSGTGPRLVGTHFWNPPHLMPLVEVIRGADTTVGAVDEVVVAVRSIGKIPVRVNHDVPGFIGNRLLHALWREAINLIERGIASAEDIDRVARLTFGLRLAAVGPLENMDLVGLDLIHTIHKYLLADLADADRPQTALSDRVASGKSGMKAGEGFHDWKRRDPAELVARRDKQIVHQLAFLAEMNAL